MAEVQIAPLGDAAVLVEWERAVRPQTLEDVWSAYDALRAALGTSVLDIVPAYASVLVRFDPSATRLATMLAVIRGALEQAREQPAWQARSFELGVSFEPEFALDLPAVSEETGLAPADVLARLCSASYRVAFLGYTAGFPYLLGLPKELNVRRLASPRMSVPAGSVAIAGGQCGIYPRTTPGGWRVLGRTAALLFDPLSAEPALLRPGDRLTFRRAASLADALVVAQ